MRSFLLYTRLLIIYTFFFSLFICLGLGQTDSVDVIVIYSGGSPLCEPTSCVDDTYFDYYTCTSEQPSLLQFFEDPIPPGNIVTSINVLLSGMFGCSVPPNIVVTVDVGAVGNSGNITFPPSTSDCLCNNCGVNITFYSQNQNEGWPGYVYSGNNSINLAIGGDSNICISQAVLSIFFRKSSPQVTSIAPSSSPINIETPVKITGSDFIPTSNLSCNFGDIVVPAYYMDYKHINCTAPSITTPETVELFITESGITNVSAGNYTFYAEPSITSINPVSGPAEDGPNVYLYGNNFFESDDLVCKFGNNLPVKAVFVSETEVYCVNPSNLQSSSTKEVTVSFSENRVQYIFSPTNYTFYPLITITTSVSTTVSPSITKTPMKTPSPPSPSSTNGKSLPGYTWTALGILLLMIIILLVGCLIATVRGLKRKQGFSSIGDGDRFFSDPDLEYSDQDPNSIAVHEIKNLRQIEKGSFGVIYEATWRGTVIAVKKLPSNLNQKLLKEFYQEAALMKSLRHPNILQYLGVAHSAGEISICMEFMTRGSLYRLLHVANSEFTRGKIKSICLDTAKGMNYLHQHNPPIIHRDLKSHNLLVDEHWRVKVCDFGLSRIIVQANATMTACGTPSWTAPEVLRNERYTTKADVYGFGVVVWEMFSRADPFPGMPPFQIVFAVGNQSLRPKISPNWPAKWVKLITDCWAEDPHARPTFEQVIARLEVLSPPEDDFTEGI